MADHDETAGIFGADASRSRSQRPEGESWRAGPCLFRARLLGAPRSYSCPVLSAEQRDGPPRHEARAGARAREWSEEAESACWDQDDVREVRQEPSLIRPALGLHRPAIQESVSVLVRVLTDDPVRARVLDGSRTAAQPRDAVGGDREGKSSRSSHCYRGQRQAVCHALPPPARKRCSRQTPKSCAVSG